VAALLAVAVSAAFTQAGAGSSGTAEVLWSPPDINLPDELPDHTVSKEMLGSFHVADMPIVLEKTELADVQKHFGGEIGERGDASEALAWLCFHGSDQGGRWILWLTSGEMGGLTWVDGLQWKRLSSGETPDARCPLLPDRRGGVELPLPIHLGSTEREVRQILGTPTLVRGNLLVFSYEHTSIVRGETVTASNDLVLVLHNHAVLEIEASKITSD
jgi:hypothetical protein